MANCYRIVYVSPFVSSQAQGSVPIIAFKSSIGSRKLYEAPLQLIKGGFILIYLTQCNLPAPLKYHCPCEEKICVCPALSHSPLWCLVFNKWPSNANMYSSYPTCWKEYHIFHPSKNYQEALGCISNYNKEMIGFMIVTVRSTLSYQ